MSTFDQASLVMIPSGYKTSKVYSIKPTDGSGDMSFSRSNDTATRVNSAGLIEKVRTNIVTYSEDFANAAWTKNNASVTSNAIANPLNGALTADLVTATANVGYVSSTAFAFAAVPYTISMYAKKSNVDWVSIEASDGVANSSKSWYNIANGTLGTTGGTYTILNRTITSVGNGWYRLTLTFSATVATNYSFVPFFVASDGALSVTGNAGYAFGTQVEASDFGATPYIATTSAAVSVGPVANVPRLDYLNSSCPRLLLEPQRTNLTLFSEQMNNAAWTAINCTVSANAATSPDGYTNADSIATTAANSFFGAASAVTISADTSTYTQSVFIKWVSGSEIVKLRAALTGGTSVAKETIANVRTGVITYTDSTAQIVSYGNGWYRISQQITNNSTNTNFNYQFYPTNDGTNTNVISLWGAMAEVGAYATSYIPTLGAAVTRGADACSKTGISSLIGSTAGTLFFEGTVNTNGEAADVFLLYNSSNISLGAYLVGFNTSGNITLYALPSASLSILKSGDNRNTRVKIALAYQSGDLVAYVNGVQTFSSAGISLAAGLSALFLNSNNTPANYGIGTYNQALLFKTRLTNAQLAELTTI